MSSAEKRFSANSTCVCVRTLQLDINQKVTRNTINRFCLSTLFRFVLFSRIEICIDFNVVTFAHVRSIRHVSTLVVCVYVWQYVIYAQFFIVSLFVINISQRTWRQLQHCFNTCNKSRLMMITSSNLDTKSRMMMMRTLRLMFTSNYQIQEIWSSYSSSSWNQIKPEMIICGGVSVLDTRSSCVQALKVLILLPTTSIPFPWEEFKAIQSDGLLLFEGFSKKLQREMIWNVCGGVVKVQFVAFTPSWFIALTNSAICTNNTVHVLRVLKINQSAIFGTSVFGRIANGYLFNDVNKFCRFDVGLLSYRRSYRLLSRLLSLCMF